MSRKTFAWAALAALAGLTAPVAAKPPIMIGTSCGTCKEECPPPYLHIFEGPPRLKFKPGCGKPVCLPCDHESFGYYPTCWRIWVGCPNCPTMNPPWTACPPCCLDNTQLRVMSQGFTAAGSAASGAAEGRNRDGGGAGAERNGAKPKGEGVPNLDEMPVPRRAPEGAQGRGKTPAVQPAKPVGENK